MPKVARGDRYEIRNAFSGALAAFLLWLAFPASAWAQDRADDRAAIVEMTYCYAYAVDILGNAGAHDGTDAGLASATAKLKQ